jgi:hypothetical protein
MNPEQKLFFIAHSTYQNGVNPTAWAIKDEMYCPRSPSNATHALSIATPQPNPLSNPHDRDRKPTLCLSSRR